MQLKEKPELNQINQESEFWAKTYQLHRYGKQRESAIVTLLKITFIYFPLSLIFFVFVIFPTFFMCGASKAKQSEGKQYVGSMNRAQQAQYAEYGSFSNSVNALNLGIKTQTTNYNYSISTTKNAVFNYAVSRSETKNIPSYVGAVFLIPVPQSTNNEKTSTAILCEVKSSGNTQPPNPILENGDLVCAPGTNLVAK